MTSRSFSSLHRSAIQARRKMNTASGNRSGRQNIFGCFGSGRKGHPNPSSSQTVLARFATPVLKREEIRSFTFDLIERNRRGEIPMREQMEAAGSLYR